MTINEAKRILKSNGYIISEQDNSGADRFGDVMLASIRKGFSYESILEHITDKMVKLYAKQAGMTENQVRNSPHMENIRKGLELLGEREVRAAHFSEDINSDKILFNKMIRALQAARNA